MGSGLAATLGDLLGGDWELRCEGNDVVASVRAGDEPVVALRLRLTRDELTAGCSVGAWSAFSRESAAWLIDVLSQTALSVGARMVRLKSVDMVLRNAARLIGFEGDIRDDLILDSANKTRISDQEPGLSSVATAIERLMPGTRVTATASTRRVRRVLQRAVSGSGTQVRVDIADGLGHLTVRAPERDDLIPEAVALAADTALAVKFRFAKWIGKLDLLSFDLAESGMSQHKIAGSYNPELPQIHLSAVMCCAELAAAAQARGRQRPPRRPSASILGGYRIDKVTAHELGHQLDFAFQSRRYKDSIEFRRRLGEALGVATLEIALRGGVKGSSPEAAIAFQRIAEDVSLYATTSTAEAMAELFALWWFSDEHSPNVVRRFGDLIEQYFPVTPGPERRRSPAQ